MLLIQVRHFVTFLRMHTFQDKDTWCCYFLPASTCTIFDRHVRGGVRRLLGLPSLDLLETYQQNKHDTQNSLDEKVRRQNASIKVPLCQVLHTKGTFAEILKFIGANL